MMSESACMLEETETALVVMRNAVLVIYFFL